MDRKGEQPLERPAEAIRGVARRRIILQGKPWTEIRSPGGQRQSDAYDRCTGERIDRDLMGNGKVLWLCRCEREEGRIRHGFRLHTRALRSHRPGQYSLNPTSDT